MTEKELLNKLNEFKQIKPNQDWAHWLLSNILSQSSFVIASEAKQSQKPKIHLVSFSFLHQYQKALVSAAFVVLFVSTFAFAQTTLPGNPLYSVKTLTQTARLFLTPKDYKPVVRMQITKVRLEDMAKITDQEQAIALMSQNIQKDLQTIPQELKNISKKQVTLKMSKQVQDEAKDLNNVISKTQLQSQDKDSLNQIAQDTQAQVLALIIDTQEEIDNCPSYLKDQLADLQKDFTAQTQNLLQWPPDDINKVRVLLADIDTDIKAGNCLEAMEKIESINQILQIHSLDSPTQNSLENLGQVKVETSTPEN
jgi:hypothetical protein